MKPVLIAVAIVVVIGGGLWVLTGNKDNKNSTQPAAKNTSQAAKSSQNSNSAQSKPTSTDQSTTATITYSNSGFSPENLTVQSGTKVTVKNDSSRDLQFDSDPHPEHT